MTSMEFWNKQQITRNWLDTLTKINLIIQQQRKYLKNYKQYK